MLNKHRVLLIAILGLSSLPSSGAPAMTNRFANARPSSRLNILFSPLPFAPQAQQINKTNWQKDPRIVAVRQIVSGIQAGLKRRAFKISERKFEYCEPYEDTLRRMAVDAKDLVRLYVKEAGSDDSALKWQHYYDHGGRLRFVFITGGAANGSELEHRVYFDDAGNRIWEEQKYVKGPGYTFPEEWPDSDLQKAEPARAFAATSPCPETKPKASRKIR